MRKTALPRGGEALLERSDDLGPFETISQRVAEAVAAHDLEEGAEPSGTFLTRHQVAARP